MITKELQNYIQESLKQGKTIEEIKLLLQQSGAGWTEQDIMEAFTPIAPLKNSKSVFKILVPIIVILVLGSGYYLYSTRISKINILSNQNIKDTVGVNNTSINPTSEISSNQNTITNSTSTPSVISTTNPESFVSEKNCGTAKEMPILDPGFELTYKNDPALKCFGESVLQNCTNAKITIPDVFFDETPATLQIMNKTNGCYFKITQYQKNYDQCPLSAVKNINFDVNKVPTLSSDLNTKDPVKYAAQIFNYATMGLLLENQGNTQKYTQNGCTGKLLATHLQILQDGRIKSKAITAQDEGEALIVEIGELIPLPQDEIPTIATVSDPLQLKNNPFYLNAKVGFKVLIYSKSNFIVLYDPALYKVINSGPIKL